MMFLNMYRVSVSLFLGILFLISCRSKNFSARNFLNSVKDSSVITGNPRQVFGPSEFDLAFDETINSKEWGRAFDMVDSAFRNESTYRYQYLGSIYAAKGDHTKAIDNFDRSVQLGRDLNPLANKLRAQVYEKKGVYEKALIDYKILYERNHYNSIHVARMFERLNTNDSALKYYQIFLGHYPDDTLVRKKISELKN